MNINFLFVLLALSASSGVYGQNVPKFLEEYLAKLKSSEVQIPQEYLTQVENALSKAIVGILVDTLRSHKFDEEAMENIGREPELVIDVPLENIGLPDPITLPNLPIPQFNIPLAPYTFQGELYFCTPEIRGLGGLHGMLHLTYDLGFNEAKVGLNMELPSLTVESLYKIVMDGVPDEPDNPEFPAFQILGEGNSNLGLGNLTLNVYVEGYFPLSSTFPMHITTLDIDVGLGAGIMYFTGLKFVHDGVDAPMEGDLGPLIKGLFDALWPGMKEGVSALVKCSLNNAIADCPLLELLFPKEGEESCLGQLVCPLPWTTTPPPRFTQEIKQDPGYCQTLASSTAAPPPQEELPQQDEVEKVPESDKRNEGKIPVSSATKESTTIFLTLVGIITAFNI